MDLGGRNRDVTTGVVAYRTVSLLSPLFAPAHIVVSGMALDTRPPGDRGNLMAVQLIRSDGTRESHFGLAGKGYVDFDAGGSNSDDSNGMTFTASGQVMLIGTTERGGTDTDFLVSKIIHDRVFADGVELD